MYEVEIAKSRSFHTLLDDLRLVRSGRPTEMQGTVHGVFQEREVRYRISPHLHPYVGRLVQRLVREGTRGMLAANIENAPGGEPAPYSVVVALKGSAQAHESMILFSGCAWLVEPLQVRPEGGGEVTLAAGTRVRLPAIKHVWAPWPLEATLVTPLEQTPAPGTELVFEKVKLAVLNGDVEVMLDETAKIELHDGSRFEADRGTRLVLRGGTELAFDGGNRVILVRKKPRPLLFAESFDDGRYLPNAEVVARPYPVNELDFASGGAYSVYNWELFFHAPFTIAIHLSKNQRYAEAQRWFHLVFDPTDNGDGPTPERFWKMRPFQTTDVKQVERLLENLATGADPALRDETIRSIEAWQDAPFRPHVIARHRQQAYMYGTVMAYLDNLVAWGDSLFRQDTGEAVDEALMLYALAANILGPRPQAVPRKRSVRPRTYDNLRKDLAQLGTAMRDVEADLPFDLAPLPANTAPGDRLAPVRSLGKALHFCVPPNEKLLGYWDTVADRLFKIRNSLSIQGVFRQLALFEPPIDPAMLARAAAAGLEVAAIVNGVNQPLPLVRFQLLVQKAAEIAQQVTSLGESLLSAMEKEDVEALSILRAKHERAILKLVEVVKYGQLQEATKAKEGLEKSLEIAKQRYVFYELQLGKKEEEARKAVTKIGNVERDALQNMSVSLEEKEVQPRPEVTSDGLGSYESWGLGLLMAAQASTTLSSALHTASAFPHLSPTLKAHVMPLGVGSTIEYGGEQIGSFIGAGAAAAHTAAEVLAFAAKLVGDKAAGLRRDREWTLQSNLAAREIAQIQKQLRAAQLREAVAEQELKSHRQHMKHAEEIEQFLNENGASPTGQKTSQALYAWMKREVKGLFAQSFQLAFDVARKAERALQHELGDPEARFVQFGYLAGKEGLLAGERLALDLKRMELAYHDLNQREYELTRHVSVLQVDPLALLQLRATGRCAVRLPEALFDLDGPGHYFRRIKSVAVSIPCAAEPYGSIGCKLTLVKSTIRKTPVLREGAYPRVDAEDDRFEDYFGSAESIVTSSAQNDAGLFDANVRDERYQPFERSGAVSEWRLELPANPGKGDPCQFDYDTISDVILHVRYTAREGGELLRKGALDRIRALADAGGAPGSVRLFSVRHEFPVAWAELKKDAGPDRRHALALDLVPEHYPFWSKGRLNRVLRVDLFARSTSSPIPEKLAVFDKADETDKAAKQDELVKVEAMGGLLAGKLDNVGAPEAPDRRIELFLDDAELSDLWVAVTWAGA